MIFDHVMDTECGPVLFENLIHLFAQPARISKLNRPAEILRCGLQERGEALGIYLPFGWQLHEYGTQKLPQPFCASEELSNGRTRLLEPHDMRAVATEFERVAKTRRRLVPPAIKDRGWRQMIKGVVDLHGVKVLGVMGKPVGMGQVFGVKEAFPVIVVITRSTDAKRSLVTNHRKPAGFID